MSRIRTDQPSTGKPVLLFIPSTTNSGFVGSGWTTIAEAPDFSIPTSGDEGVVVDPSDADRELRPGEIFIETPLAVTHVSGATAWVEAQIVLQGNSGQAIPITSKVPVPSGETCYLPIQGLRLLRELVVVAATSLTSANNGRQYEISSIGTTDFTLIGAATNTAGTVFTKSGGTGSGTGEALVAGFGGRLQVRAEVSNALKIIGTAVELEASDHAPDTEAL